MDRNLVLAIVFSGLIILGFQYYFQSVAPPHPKQPTTKEDVKGAEKPSPPKPEHAAAPEERASTLASEPTSVKQMSADTTGARQESLIVVDGPQYEATLSTRGGRIVSFKLKNYKVSLSGDELEDIFNQTGPDTAGPTLMLTTRDETLVDSAVDYRTESPKSVKLEPKGAAATVTFEAPTSANVIVTKKFVFKPDTYEVNFGLSLANKSAENRNFLLTLPWRKVFSTSTAQKFSWDSAEILLNGQLKDYPFKSIKGEEEPSGDIEWAGLGDTYFFKALVFAAKPASKVSLLKPSPDGLSEIRVRYGAIDLAPGDSSEQKFSLYLGPKERTALQAAGDNLGKALVYSYYWLLNVMAEGLMIFLRFCNTGFEIFGVKIPGTRNYGIDIIILTIVIKLLFIPLSHKSMKSMKRMQDLQPQLAKIKEKHKDDKAAVNKATMDLFKEYKVNPLGSCWPMFLQLPVFIALYQALAYAIELRHAPFVCFPSIYLCIQDLSAPDPHYITPVLMGGTMLLQQWLTPGGGDPTQRKMMLIMPVVFTWLFLSFPAGLVLYWLVSNILTIAQQIITNKMAS